jgi:hypothetical protein
VILFDEFAGFTLNGPDGHVNAARYPSFARLARDSTWYRNATTVADYTERAVPALLTGDRPDKAALPIASDHPESLFTLLGGSYDLDVTEPVTDICPARLCPEEDEARPSQAKRLDDLTSDLSLVSLHLLLPRPLRNELAPIDRSFGDFRATEPAPGARPSAPASGAANFAALAAVIDRMRIFDAFEKRIGDTPQQGSLVFFHIQLPHNPYHYLPSGQRYPETIERMPGIDTEGQPAGGGWRNDPGLTRQGLQRYLLQIGDTDRLLGRLIDRMKASGLYDKALLVVAADHGAGFLEGHPHRAADPINLPSIASIPLFVKSPGQHRGEINEENVSVVDVLPTIADRLGVKLPWSTDGRPAKRDSGGGSIRLQPHYGDADLTMPFAEYLRRRDKLVGWMLGAFGTSPGGIYEPGPDADLAGREVAGLGAADAPGARFELDGGGQFEDVRPNGAIVPTFVTGELSGVSPRARLAVAVDGRVAAPAVQWRDGDVTRVSALVPPSAYARGTNSVGLVAISGSGSSRRFAQLGGGAVGYRLADGAIVDGSGRRIAIARGNGGSAESIAVGQAEVRINGWAGDPERRRAAERVVAFAGSRLLAAGRPELPREDVARRYGKRFALSGFSLNGWTSGPTPGSPGAPIKVFAIAGGRALELPKPKPASFPSGQ